MNKFTVIIPARLNSSRLPYKMTLDVGGEPLIVRTAKQALKSKANQVVVATDHKDILEACSRHNIHAIMTANTHVSGTDRLAEAAQILKLANNEVIVNVQGDEPLIDPNLINELAEFIMQQQTEIATIAHPISLEDEIFNPNIVKVVLDNKNHAMYFSRSAIPFYRNGYVERSKFELPPNLKMLRHIGIYAYSVNFLNNYNKLDACALEQTESLEQLRAMYYGYKISVLVTNSKLEAGVDTPEDLVRVRMMFQQSK